MTQRLTRANRFTVYFKQANVAEAGFQCEAEDRQDAIDKLVADRGTKELVITRIVPSWPKPKKEAQP